MLIQLAANKSIKDLLLKAPIEYDINFIKELSPPMRISLISFDHKVVSHEDFQTWLYSQDEITVADYNYYVKMRSTIPSDPSFTSQWHHNNTGNNGGTLDADIDSDLAWDITTGGTTATNDDIVVCMVEGGGGNLDHLDLSPNRWVNTGEIPNDNIDNDGNGYVDDYPVRVIDIKTDKGFISRYATDKFHKTETQIRQDKINEILNDNTTI